LDYPNLWDFTRELFQIDGIAETTNMNHIVRHYHYSHEPINPNRIIPIKPDRDFMAPHNRG
jgi:putative glutathione S-transferase